MESLLFKDSATTLCTNTPYATEIRSTLFFCVSSPITLSTVFMKVSVGVRHNMFASLAASRIEPEPSFFQRRISNISPRTVYRCPQFNFLSQQPFSLGHLSSAPFLLCVEEPLLLARSAIAFPSIFLAARFSLPQASFLQVNLFHVSLICPSQLFTPLTCLHTLFLPPPCLSFRRPERRERIEDGPEAIF